MGTLGFHTLDTEADAELPVEGNLPTWLDGSLIRNGPALFEAAGTGVDHWFDGLAMLHRFSFDDGRVRYRNRFLRTESYERARGGEGLDGFATGNASVARKLKSLLVDAPYDNTNIVAERFGDRYLALTETPRAVAFDPETLDTLGHVRYDRDEPHGQLACAHLQRDPWTGRFVSFETEFGRPSRYHVFETDDATSRRHVGSVPVDEPAYMHSFALTPNYVVLTEFPFVVDPLEMLTSAGAFVDAFRWTPERGTRFVVLDRRSGGVVATTTTEAFFGFHHVDAYERDVQGRPAPAGDPATVADDDTDERPRPGSELVVDVETVPDAESLAALSLERLRSGDLGVFGGSLDRFVLSLRADGATVDHERLHDGTSLPTASPARRCRPYRYAYAQETDQPVTEWPTRLVKVDVETGESWTHRAHDGHVGEPVFVPRTEPNDPRDVGSPPLDAPEDDGLVLAVELDEAAGHSWLVVLDGESFEERARAAVPHAIPFDFHGRYFPEL
ncbi:carotenoid oxygenase family protein [Halomarina oriensis]|uniref:Beta-carotene 15,15'-monooxygenase n=1 Tax=Halomarina oriensis TaxID=671145 RepID=A0A6B0GTU8_9EURY|nr:carotenoid oxygenase family protein [Halomarina oriensis]MWG36797.1 beta-carotene 15,15'-monooxygenase [Halomarina oriensis]